MESDDKRGTAARDNDDPSSDYAHEHDNSLSSSEPALQTEISIQRLNYERLEAALREVKVLTSGLSAEVVVQEGHEEIGYWTEEGRNHTQVQGNDVWVATEPAQSRITQPDTQRREAARTQLQQIHDSSEWYSARYAAGQALGVDFRNQEGIWIEDLSRRIVATKATTGAVEKIEPVSNKRWGDRDSGGYASWGEESRHNIGSNHVPDIEARLKAVEDIRELSQLTNSPEARALLKEGYRDNDSKEVRASAGKALGYSDLRIWAHEHPTPTAIVTGIAIAAAASGLGHLLYQHFNR